MSWRIPRAPGPHTRPDAEPPTTRPRTAGAKRCVSSLGYYPEVIPGPEGSPRASNRLGEFALGITPAGRILSALVLILLAGLFTYRIIAGLPIGLIIYGLFAVVLLALVVPTDLRAGAVRVGVFGVYLMVVGFGRFGGRQIVPLGAAGVAVLLISVWSFIATARRLRRISG